MRSNHLTEYNCSSNPTYCSISGNKNGSTSSRCNRCWSKHKYNSLHGRGGTLSSYPLTRYVRGSNSYASVRVNYRRLKRNLSRGWNNNRYLQRKNHMW